MPKFLVIANPKYGYLKKFSQDKKSNKNRSKRRTNLHKSLSEFNHEDILKGRIAYIGDNDLDLSYPNEIMTDVVHYELSAHNVPSGFGVLVINIVNHKLITTTMYWDIKDNKTYDLENEGIGIYHENEINYLNIIITRDHLLIAFVFLVVVILTIALIVIIRVCHSSGTNTGAHNDKSAPITGQLNITPTILDTPPASDYGGDILMMSSRLSPRSTPSVSEVEMTAMRAPPTSPSMSTNCSVLDVRSHSGTPRGYLRPTMIDHLRGGCGATEDSPEEATTSIFPLPLPPPNLYFGSECENVSPTSHWGTSSVPMCKVPPIFPRCLEDHYCATYHHSLYPYNHNKTLDMPTRVLGDGTSLVGSPVPSLRKTPWSAEDLFTASTSNNCIDHNSLQSRNRMVYNNNFKIQNPDIYITDNYTNDCLGLQQNLDQTEPKQKQQYWV
jgi:hypothetical protein